MGVSLKVLSGDVENDECDWLAYYTGEVQQEVIASTRVGGAF